MNRTQLVILLLVIVLLYVFNYKNNKFRYVYKDDFMSSNDFENLLCELEKYNEKLNKSKEEYPNLIRFNLKMDSPIINSMIKKYENKIKSLTKNYSIYLAKNFPIEYRKYVPGSFMTKHQDTLIYKLPQYECVFTLSNTTDSYTDIEGRKISSKPNSLIIVKALGVEHEVSKVTKGERKFLKFIFTETDEFAK